MKIWSGEVDFDSTIRDYEFTRRAARKLNRAVESKDFDGMEAEIIYQTLEQEMEIYVFKDFLKRYIHDCAEMTENMRDISDEIYKEILVDAFRENRVPFSIKPTSKRPGAIINGWFTQDCVKRTTIFSLGFGLGMSELDVSLFLEKVIKEDNFRYWDVDEVIYWYCFHNRLGYSKVIELKQKAETLVPDKKYSFEISNIISNQIPAIHNEAELLQYICFLKKMNITEGRETIAYQIFQELYQRCQEIISRINQKIEDEKNKGKICRPGDVTPADLEKKLCDGIPLTKSGNLTKMSLSYLARQFDNKRMSRQRIDGLLTKRLKIERFDIITLLFYIYAEEIEPDWPVERYLQYIDEINELLDKCGMMGIYPANPYESFVLMCLLSNDPLQVYNEIWARSYGEAW